MLFEISLAAKYVKIVPTTTGIIGEKIHHRYNDKFVNGLTNK
jgi:hypothetical protein